MNKFRQLIVRFNDKSYIDKFYLLLFSYLNKFNARNIRINYKKSYNNSITLLGYDKKIKHRFSKISKKTLDNLIRLVNKMPMRNTDYKYNKPLSLHNICGLDNTLETSHCFNDYTHQTCCLLGYKARRYADKTSNPIGKASEEIFKKYFNKKPNKNDLTPWCTCIGSKVCSFYASKFDDGTHIKSINNYRNNKLYFKISNGCEEKIRDKIGYLGHKTPGILKNKNSKKIYCDYKEFNYE